MNSPSTINGQKMAVVGNIHSPTAEKWYPASIEE
jgi:hypothetical protein